MDIRIVDGRLTRNAEVKVNQTSGTKFLTFTLVNNGFSKGAQTATFFNVVSYNEHDINRAESLTKGKMVIVNGRPNESIGVKNNQTYLNRNIMANSIEFATPNIVKDSVNIVKQENTQAPQTNAVHFTATCEVPPVVAPAVSTPVVNTPSVVNATTPVQTTTQPQFRTNPVTQPPQVPVTTPGTFQSSINNTPQVAEIDDLPF